MKTAESLIQDLVVANHVLAQQGVVDGYGHVSVRGDRDPSLFLLSRSLAPELVTPEDILEFNLDSVPVEPRGQFLYRERFIHGEIYKTRPDVQAIVHSHAPELIPFGVCTTPLQPIYHMSYFIGEGIPVFEIRKVDDGSANLLVDTPLRGRALAETLGMHAAALMRGHGAVVVASSLGDAVARCVFLVINAKAQAQAVALGGPITYLDREEVSAMTESFRKDGYRRAWDMWKRRASR